MISRIARRLLRPRRKGAMILLYHRIADEAIDPWGLCVSPSNFVEQLRILQRHACCLPLPELVSLAQERRLPRNAVALTFDDGYADNLWAARPLLEQAGIPATIFITTGAVGKAREFWWDALERLLLHPTELPTTLELCLGRTRYRWTIELMPAGKSHARDAWRAGHDPPPSARHALYLELWERLQLCPAEEQQRVLEELAVWAGTPLNVRSTRRALDEGELGELARSGLLELGAHTITHPMLPAQPAMRQHHEIHRSKADLERMCGRPVSSFSYPHGRHDDLCETIVRENGFAIACGTMGTPIGAKLNHFALRRMPVADWDGESFARWFATWSA